MATDELSNVRSPVDGRAASPLVSGAALPARAQRALTFGLALSALRCTIQYVVLPFVLPWVGVASAIPPWLTLALGLLALAALARNVRYLWRQRHARRWSYLLLAAIVAVSLIVFAVVDLHALLGR